MKVIAYFSALMALVVSVVAFSVPDQSQSRPSQEAHVVSRAQWLQSSMSFAAGVAMMGTTATPAFAKDDAAVKGTKKDPSFEACLSTCMYECTKPKGVEQKSRQECLPECKSKCATTKAQLMTGTPKE